MSTATSVIDASHSLAGSASTKIKRAAYGLMWNAALEAGGVLVGDEVKIQLEVELIKQA